jgi:hypothetical protein|tara:strand:- start:331 stop:504 length:174 start_codon:yes stop_codon:yes gene_type:complete
MKIFKYFLSRLKERSTWLGMISIVTALGVSLSSEQSEAIIAAGISVAGLVAVFTKDG